LKSSQLRIIIYYEDTFVKRWIMDYITIKEASEKWGVSTRAILYHVVAGRIPGAVKKADLWLIPTSTEKPEDRRKYNRRQLKN
jgi:hypothetical protein